MYTNLKLNSSIVKGVHMVHSKSYTDYVNRSVSSGGIIVFLEKILL